MLEQLYTDFTTKLLPQIQTGLAITKEYFFDLFARYIKYLIVTDSIYTGIGLIMFITGLIFIIIFFRKTQNPKNGGEILGWVFLGITLTVIGFVTAITNGNNLIKDIYIPEIRIYQEIKNFNPK